MIPLPTIPESPGCYLFKDSTGVIIYVGKAKVLKRRVLSYFQKNHHDGKTSALVSHIDGVSFIVTDSEVEALLLENTLIKRHQPRYNINLKDAKSYAFLELTAEEFPRLIIARAKRTKGEYFGPFVSGQERDEIKKAMQRIFRIRTCRRLPKRACLRYHLGLCTAPCIGNVSKEEYGKQVADASAVLSGHTRQVLAKLASEMKQHAKEERYEQALPLRNQINALERLAEHQKIQRKVAHNEDIINYRVKDGQVYLMLFHVYQGTLADKQEFSFPLGPDFLEEFLVQYYSESPIPKSILVPEPVGDDVAAFLSRERKVSVTIPKIGPKKQLLDLVDRNIEVTFFGELAKLEDLQQKLRLHELPRVMECFDISHLSGTGTVASMVQFRMGKPFKSEYRRFRIRTVAGVDDFASMEEVVTRRYRRLLAENGQLPDLVVIDGGMGQLQAAMRALASLGVRLPIISLAKRFEEVYVPGRSIPYRFGTREKAVQLLQAIRDEAHRFAITYQKLVRKKKFLGEE